MAARWTKLQSGEWGIKVIHETPFDTVNEGDQVTVTKKDGGTSDVVVDKVLWTGEDEYADGARASLCAIKPRPAKA